MAKSASAARRTDALPAAEPSEARGSGLLESGARLLPLRAGFYVFTLVPSDPGGGSGANPSPAAVQICAAPDSAAVEMTNLSGREDQWLGGLQRLFVTAPPGDATVLLTGYRPRSAEPGPIDVEIRRLDRNATAESGTLVLGLAPDALDATEGFSLEAVAVLRGAGEVRFIDSGWIGHLGRGLWLESFTVTPLGRSLPPIEYKALGADGEETPWTDAGSPCGTAGGTVPLIGFSVRQRPGSGPPVFDCEYSGYFQSGAISGPARNGTPCLSAAPNDPLEGLKLRLLARPPRPSA